VTGHIEGKSEEENKGGRWIDRLNMLAIALMAA